VDIAPAYVDHARRRNSDNRLEFHIGDGCAIQYPDKSFDRVLSLLVLMFVPQPQKMIAEMCRVARPGATVAAAAWDFSGGFPRVFLDTAAVLDPKADQVRARLFSRPMTRRGELANAWRSAGLTDVMEAMASIRMEYQSFEDYWAPYVGGQGPAADYVGTLTDAERTRLQGYVLRAYLGGDADGPRSYSASAWVVKGTAPA
jgi:ubiquinone/menaquinone biosynthesis C-methylase UbiE